MFFLAGDLLNGVTAFAGGFVGFDTAAVRRVVNDVHWPAAT